MVTVAQQHRSVRASTNQLREAGILRQVFSYLPGNWLYLGAVCSEWRAVCACMEDQQVCSLNTYGIKQVLACGPSTTLYSVAVSSPATARLACELGLQVDTDHRVQRIAGLHADVQTLTVLFELGMPLNDTLVSAVALSGRLDVLQHLVTDHKCPIPQSISHHAARSGSVSMLQWLEAKSLCDFDLFTCIGAAAAGQVAAQQHLIERGCHWDKHYIARHAASSGNIEMVDWLRQQQGMQIDAEVLSWAAGAGKTAMCQYLRSIGCDWDINACESAAGHGQLDTLRWLRDNGCPWIVSDVCMRAAAYGLTAILDYVIEQGEVLGAELLTDALNTAGASDNLQAAQWLRHHGAQWPAVLTDDHFCYGLRWSGESLAWARAEGCTSPVTL
jgi:hypothetical protein